MQLTESADASPESADAPQRLRKEVVDALFARKGIVHPDGKPAPTWQARELGLHKSHWFRIRSGEVVPLVSLVDDVAAYLGSSVDAIYGRG